MAAVDSAGEFRADKLDLATLSLIANRLPLGAQNHANLTSLAPKGVIQSIAATWRGNLEVMTELNAKGIVTDLQIASQHNKTMLGEGENLHEDLGRPGVRGARVEFEFNLNGGTAKVDIYPMHLMKAILTNDFERIEGLGIYELSEEDVALCEFVCTSKQPLQEILRDGLELMHGQS